MYLRIGAISIGLGELNCFVSCYINVYVYFQIKRRKYICHCRKICIYQCIFYIYTYTLFYWVRPLHMVKSGGKKERFVLKCFIVSFPPPPPPLVLSLESFKCTKTLYDGNVIYIIDIKKTEKSKRFFLFFCFQFVYYIL